MSMVLGGRGSSLSEIRVFLRADSPEGLVRLQLLTNTKLKSQAQYTDFSNVDGQWYCWFLVDVDRNAGIIGELIGNTAKPN